MLGAWSGRRTAIGCGSKVTATTVLQETSSATSRARRTTCWWPRWTPSKLPMVTTVRPRSSGTSVSERQICTSETLPHSAHEDCDRLGPLAVDGFVERQEFAVGREQERKSVV